MAFYSFSADCPICKEGKQFIFVRDFIKDGQEYSLYECECCRVQFWVPQKIIGNVWYENNNPYQVRSLAGIKISRGYHKVFLKNNKSFPINTKVLDLGCGTGEFIAELKKRGCNVFGVDFDRDAIKIAKDELGLENVYPLSFEEFFKKQDLPKFDIITAFEVIEHLTDPLAFMNSVKALLKEDGRIILSTPCRERILPDLNNWDFPPHHFLRWNQEAISNIFSKIGFKISDISYVEQFKILSETVMGRFETGLVAKLLNQSHPARTSIVIPKIVYILGQAKGFLLGRIPAFILLIFSKITNHKNGIIMVELKLNERPKKVFLLATSLEMGGMERVIADLSLNLSAEIERTIVLLRHQATLPYDFGKKIVSFSLPASNNIYNLISGVIRLRKLIKNEKPDHVVSFGFHANIANVLSCKKSIVRADTYLSVAHGRFGRFLIKHIYSKAQKIVCVSFGVAQDLVKNLKIKKDKIKVIYNPIDIKKILYLAEHPSESEYKYIFDSPVIINAGRLEKQKGQQFLIKAFKGVKKEVKDAKLVFLGIGGLESELKQLVKNLGLENSVYFLGWQKNPFKFFSKSKIFVSSSLREGLPGAILEAMACGLPIISTDCKSGPREILALKTDIAKEAKNIEFQEYGILTPVLNAEKFLEDAIIRILTDKKLSESLSKKSLQRASDFDVSKIIKEWDFLGKNV